MASSPSWLRWFPQFRIKNDAEQLMPVVEIALLGVEVKGEEESTATAVVVSSLQPQLAQVVSGGMEGKSNQVQGHQRVGQSLPDMSEVVFHVIMPTFVLCLTLPLMSLIKRKCRHICRHKKLQGFFER